MNKEYLDNLKNQMGASAQNRRPIRDDHQNAENEMGAQDHYQGYAAQQQEPYPDSLDKAMKATRKVMSTAPVANPSRIQDNILAFSGAGSRLDPKPILQPTSANNQATQTAQAAYLQNKQRFRSGNNIF